MQVDATEEDNKALASKYEIQGFPTLKVTSWPERLDHRCTEISLKYLKSHA